MYAERFLTEFVMVPLTLLFGGLLPPVMDVAPLEEGLLLAGRETLAWDGEPGILRASEAGFDRFYRPVTSPSGSTVAVWAGSDGRSGVVLVGSEGLEVLGPYGRAGLPCWDGSGGLWFTADGELLLDGEPSGTHLDSHHISVSFDGDRVVFTDRVDRILRMDTAGGAVDTVSAAHRFYGPFFIPDGRIVSPSLDGGIWIFDGDDALAVGPGDQPAWWPERNALVYVRTEDDGMRLLSSDIWIWTEEEGSRRVAGSGDRIETRPRPAGDGVFFVDGEGRLDWMVAR